MIEEPKDQAARMKLLLRKSLDYTFTGDPVSMTCQAVALDLIFRRMLTDAEHENSCQMVQYKTAFQAQQQCVATMNALIALKKHRSDVKNPP